MTAVAAPSIAPAAPAPAEHIDDTDADVIAAGKKIEALLPIFATTWIEWAKLHRAAKAETVAKFGDRYDNPAWSKPTTGALSPAHDFLHKALVENGTFAAEDRLAAIRKEIDPLVEAVREAATDSIGGLRAKAAAEIYECWPVSAVHDASFSFEDPVGCWSLFCGALGATGLEDFFWSLADQLHADATKKDEDTEVVA